MASSLPLHNADNFKRSWERVTRHFELGAPSDVQIEAWRTDIALPVVDAPQMGWLQGAAGMVAAPTALAALVVAAGVLTHHLQVHVFVI